MFFNRALNLGLTKPLFEPRADTWKGIIYGVWGLPQAFYYVVTIGNQASKKKTALLGPPGNRGRVLIGCSSKCAGELFFLTERQSPTNFSSQPNANTPLFLLPLSISFFDAWLPIVISNKN